ncbi:hypothetical protein AB1Y20_003263 [Prymnesium parvum]|uniref:Uncharacterized protein n=1 Tax=Prymnesium parvum TaxID=97485 RepID=A0AB34JEC0_PRYPA|mmetsp:Transcript_35800/g.89068  ORF Transcript_35800/g.89068 Transcript_35800/m.89068 type:complete len:175 (-) Transcript_35800:406-930(-)
MAEPGVATATAVPVGTRVDETQQLRFQLELERESAAAVARLTSKFSALEHKESQRFKASLEHTVQQAQARVVDSARMAVDKQVAPALRAHLTNSAAASEAVQDVCFKLEQRAEENAKAVVARVAGEAAVTRAIEAKCMARLDEKMRHVYLVTALAPFLTAGLAVCAARWWDSRR